MEVILAVTKSCHHCPILEKELKRMRVVYSVRYYEDHPEMVEQYGIKKSPAVIVDGEVVFRGMPSIPELEHFFKEEKPPG